MLFSVPYFTFLNLCCLVLSLESESCLWMFLLDYTMKL